jgi:hypothetical protein
MCVHKTKVIAFDSIQCSVQDLILNDSSVFSGIVTEKTKIVFRSKSSQLLIYLQYVSVQSLVDSVRCVDS